MADEKEGTEEATEEKKGGMSIVVVLIVAPVVGTLMQLALSRAREFDADLEAAQKVGCNRSGAP